MAFINRITAWSFSRWKDYEQCPRKAKYKHVDRMKEPAGEAMERGSNIHTLCETFLKSPNSGKGAVKKPNPEMALFAKQFLDLKRQGAIAEQEWALNAAWEKTQWVAKDTWLRIKMDAVAVNGTELRVIDFKTGKEKPDHALQLELYAAAGLSLYPDIQYVTAELWYLDSGSMDDLVHGREQLAVLKSKWMQRIKKMMADTTFSPKPGNYCRWCHFSKAKGGPCQF